MSGHLHDRVLVLRSHKECVVKVKDAHLGTRVSGTLRKLHLRWCVHVFDNIQQVFCQFDLFVFEIESENNNKTRAHQERVKRTVQLYKPHLLLLLLLWLSLFFLLLLLFILMLSLLLSCVVVVLMLLLLFLWLSLSLFLFV